MDHADFAGPAGQHELQVDHTYHTGHIKNREDTHTWIDLPRQVYHESASGNRLSFLRCVILCFFCSSLLLAETECNVAGGTGRPEEGEPQAHHRSRRRREQGGEAAPISRPRGASHEVYTYIPGILFLFVFFPFLPIFQAVVFLSLFLSPSLSIVVTQIPEYKIPGTWYAVTVMNSTELQLVYFPSELF